MVPLEQAAHRFRVHARHLDAHHARLVEEPSFEAAAVAYVEGLHLAPGLADEGAISVIVRDVHTGHERSFLIDLQT
jgi:hypothetical protein